MRNSEEDVLRMREIFHQRRDLIGNLLSEMPHISFPKPDGAFYVFVNVQECIGKKFEGKVIEDDISFCSALLEAELVAVVPGSAFLAPGYLRVSYASSPQVIEEGMKRLKRFLERIED
jgi:aspartate aminotransferase